MRILKYIIALAAGVSYFGICIIVAIKMFRKKQKTEAITWIILNVFLLFIFIVGVLDFW